MKKIFLFAAFAMLVAGCEKSLTELPDIPDNPVDDKDPIATDASLSITTRADGDSRISYPIAVFVFDSEDKCVTKEVISAEGEALSVDLVQGSYDILAVAGADEDVYSVPAEEDAVKTAEILLRSGQKHTDLMTAVSSIDLKPGNTTLTIGFQRKVIELSSVVIRQIPADVTAVSVSLSPSYQGITLSGDYVSRGSQEVSLTKQSDDSTWQLADAQYLLVTPDGATITVTLDVAGVKKNFTYTCKPNELAANYRINISGTYTEVQTLQLSGTITGASWNGSTDIAFTFDSNGASSEQTEPQPGSDVPQAGSFYNDCYVISVTDKGDSYEVLLLHPEQKRGIVNAENWDDNDAVLVAVNAALETMTVEGVSGWRLPTSAEADVIIEKCDEIEVAIDEHTMDMEKRFNPSDLFLYLDGSTVKSFNPEQKDSYSLSTGGDPYLRPVATVIFDKN